MLSFCTYDFEVEVFANHDVAGLEVAMADLKIAVEVLKEDDELGGVHPHYVNWEARGFRDILLERAEWDVLHDKEKTLLVLKEKLKERNDQSRCL